MSLQIKTDIARVSDSSDRILRFVTHNKFLDHNLNFTAFGEDVVRRAVAVHISTQNPTPSQSNAPYPWQGSLGVDPFIAIEDEAGNLTALQHCREVLTYEHAYGVLFGDLERNEFWLIPAASGGSITVDEIAEERTNAIRLTGIIADLMEEAGAVFADRSFSEGEFYYSNCDQPELAAIAWWSDAWGPIVEGKGQPADIAMKEALEKRIERERVKLEPAIEMTGP